MMPKRNIVPQILKTGIIQVQQFSMGCYNASSVICHRWFVMFQFYILVTYQQQISCLFTYKNNKRNLLFSLSVCTKTDQLLICNQYTNSLVSPIFVTQISLFNTTFQKIPILHLKHTMKQKFLH